MDDGNGSRGPHPAYEAEPAERPIRPGRPSKPQQQLDDEDVQPYPERTVLPPLRAEDPFFVAMDERDPGGRRKISAAAAVFLSDLLTMKDRQAFGWSLMITDVMALVEQQVLIHSSFFYGYGMSSFGVIMNTRASLGADPWTMLLD